MEETERRLLRRTWFPVARIEDADQGPLEANVLGTELVVYRVDGRTTVAAGRCPHRGAALWLGAVRDACLECPYHGWLFEPGTGQCVEIPSLPAGTRPPGIRLTTYPVREAYGHIWTCLGDPYLPFPRMQGYGETGWRFAFGPPADLSCGMRQITENFRDMAHFPFVHTGTMGPHVRREVGPYEVRREGWDLQWELATDLGGTALDGHEVLARQQTITYRITLPMAAYNRTTFPDGGKRFVAQFATPLNEEGTRVRLFWVAGINEVVLNEHGVSIEEMWEYERQIFEEDFPIVENQRPVEAPLDPRAQVHTRSDKYGIAFRRLYRELLDTFARDEASEGEVSEGEEHGTPAAPVSVL